jgi:hypothetical protein
MRAITVFAFLFTFVLGPFPVWATNRLHLHVVPMESNRFYARSDFMVGIMLQSQCDAIGARQAYEDALSHIPGSAAAKLALVFLPVWLKAEAIRYVEYARSTGRIDYYITALRCDPDNEEIAREYLSVLRMREDHRGQATDSPMYRPQF